MVILTFASSKGVILPLKKAILLEGLDVNVNSVVELGWKNYNFDRKITQYRFAHPKPDLSGHEAIV